MNPTQALILTACFSACIVGIALALYLRSLRIERDREAAESRNAEVMRGVWVEDSENAVSPRPKKPH